MGSADRFSPPRRPMRLARPAPPARRATRPFVPGAFLIVGLVIFGFALSGQMFAPAASRTDPAPDAPRAVTSVIDGDTLRVGADKVRLVGIDAPEQAQTCRDGTNRTWACGQAATLRLRQLVAGHDVTCTPRGHDRYGRTLAVCAAGAVADLGRVLVREGHAVSYSVDSGYAADEDDARIAGRGVWQGAFERPQDWRRRQQPAG